MIKEIPKWDDYFMSMVYLVASRSKDNKTHIGAVVVGQDKEVVSLGYNGFPRGTNDYVHERQEKPIKFEWFEHAERNAIYNATLIGVSLKGCKMYTNGTPCTNCSRGIIQSGIKEVIIDKMWDETNSHEDKKNFEISLQMFNESGVKVKYWEGKLLNVERYRRWEIMKEDKIMNLKIKKIHPNAVIPKYAHDGDAGMDIVAIEKNITDKYVEYKTGLSLEIPEGHVCLIFPRSSISKKDLVLCNSVGVLDSGYRGELTFRFQNLGKDHYEVGEKIGQIMILPYPQVKIEEVDELSSTERGEGGWGSTGTGL